MRHPNRLLLALGLTLLLTSLPIASQAAPGHGDTPPTALTPSVGYAVRSDISPALRDMPRIAPDAAAPSPPDTNLRLPKALGSDATASPDPALQSVTGPLAMPSPLTSFDGIGNVNGVLPPDTQGDIGYDPATGTRYYVQWVNVSFAIWDVTGTPTQILGPVSGNTLWQGFGGDCETNNHGDPITLYDTMANRWLMSQFSVDGPYYQCIAISQTADPTGPWHRYAFMVSPNKMNDYPHFGVWPDGYYMTVNQFTGGSSWGGAGVFVFERDKMLTGDPTASFQYFDLYSVSPFYGGMLPSDLDGSTLPPAGAPNYFLEVDNGPDELSLWEFHVDWQDPANTSFGINGLPNAVMPTAAFTPICSYTRSCIAQQGTTARLDAISDRLMYRVAYRNYGTHESLVLNHTVDAGGGVAGVRWYEVRDPDTAPAIFQQGTHSPDSDSRWMGSIAMDAVGNIALGYSVSSSSMYPSVRYAGRLDADPLGTLPQAETSLVEGSGHQTHDASRWGDYSMMGIDPVDDCTFWYTQEYMATSGSAPWSTRIGSFRFPDCATEAPGTLAGEVTDSGSGRTLAGAQVVALGDEGATGSTLTGPDGSYGLSLDAGTYTVTVSAYGQVAGTTSGIVIASEETTIHDVALAPSATYVVSGTVTDAQTGWPLYARVSVVGDPVSPPAPENETWTNPETGAYSLTLASDITYTLGAYAWVDGYQPAGAQLAPLTGDETVDFALTVNAATCDAPGYTAVPVGTGIGETFDAGTLPSGWSTVDHAGDGVAWAFDDPGTRTNLTGGTGLFAGIDSDLAGYKDVDTSLLSPAMDFASNPAVVLQFKYDFNWWSSDTDEVADVDVSNDGGSSWTNVWRRHGHDDRGPKTASVDISSLAGGESYVRVRFRYYDANFDYWWQVDDVNIGAVDCRPVPGGLVVGDVSDTNTGGAVQGSVSNDAGYVATASVQDAPDSGAFYTIFAPTGASTITATAAGYAPEFATVPVTAGSVTRQDLALEAGMLEASPTGVTLSLHSGMTETRVITLSNQGGNAVGFEIEEIDAPYAPAAVTGPFAGSVRRVSPKHLHDLTAATVREYTPPDVPELAAGSVLRTWRRGLADSAVGRRLPGGARLQPGDRNALAGQRRG